MNGTSKTLRWADEYGFTEAWIGEHHTAPWEPHPSPDLLVAQSLKETSNIRLGPGGFLLPYHHPAELANRVAILDHLAEGRLNFGVAASGLPSDWAMFNVDGMSGQNREMTREALDIILRLWTEAEPFEHKGKYWSVSKTDVMFDTLRPHLKPLQEPHPPIGVAGLSKNSDTLKMAGEHGFIPMSLNLNPAYVGSHWEAVEEGAAKVGRRPHRGEWRLVREILVAETGEEAMRFSAGDMMGRNDGGVLPAAPRQLRLHRLPEARSGGAGFGRDPRVLRAPQLGDRVTGHGGREARAGLRRGRRLRDPARLLLRLRPRAGDLAELLPGC